MKQSIYKDSFFEKIRFLINNSQNKEITRQQLIKYSNNVGVNTIDSYRALLTAGKYLRKITPGKYFVLKKIPNNLSLNKLRSKIYKGRYNKRKFLRDITNIPGAR